MFFGVSKVPISKNTILSKSNRHYQSINNLVYPNHLKKIKMCKLNNVTKTDSSFNIFENKSIDNFFNFKKFHYYRTLE